MYTGFDFCKKLCGFLNDSKWQCESGMLLRHLFLLWKTHPLALPSRKLCRLPPSTMLSFSSVSLILKFIWSPRESSFPREKYSPSIGYDEWSVGNSICETIGRVRNEKAGRYLRSMRLKKSIRFSHKLPHDDPLDLRILQKLLSFELNERPTFEEVLHKIILLHSLWSIWLYSTKIIV